MKKPTIGRIVNYHTTVKDKKLMELSNDNVVDILPAVIVNVWSDECLNLKVITDGNSRDLWKTSVNNFNTVEKFNTVESGFWSWPEIIGEPDTDKKW